ncbi:HNH endonuclease [Rhodomicrobium vannielii ATCC 17100]|nr:HNH endonuclease [Rhodomicrobium vannielii ATCC 17100]
MADGRVTPASQVDHFIPITAGGSVDDWDNLKSSCPTCHTHKTNRESGSAFNGRRWGVDPKTGLPLDPSHEWSE